MTDEDDVIDRLQATSENAIVQAKLGLDDAVSRYAGVVQAGSDAEASVARTVLHKSVIDLWWRMRPALIAEGAECWTDVSEMESWDREEIWSGEHPRTGEPISLTGLADLEEWVDKQATVERELAGPKFGGKTQAATITLALPGPAALRCSQVLGQAFREFGWDASTKDETPMDDPDLDDIRELATVRGQDQALDSLPGDA